jgi:GNAT superfamily N-acetyltransferase
LFIVRPANLGDADEIAAIHLDSIHSLGSKAYGPDVIADWGAPRDGSRYRLAMDGGELFFLAVRNDESSERAFGFSSYRVEDGKHRTAIYVQGDAARSGIGTALFEAAENTARERGATELHVDASLAAVNFYESVGFERLATSQHRLNSGAVMDCVFMRKRLSF